MATPRIALADLKETIYVRRVQNDAHVAHLKTLYEEGANLPPVEVTRESKNWSKDGIASQRHGPWAGPICRLWLSRHTALALKSGERAPDVATTVATYCPLVEQRRSAPAVTSDLLEGVGQLQDAPLVTMTADDL
jgi:hypothetical protein